MRNRLDIEGRWIAFRLASTLPPNAQVRVIVPSGLRSAEGPHTTTEAQSFEFKTHGSLRLMRAACLRGDKCEPLDSFRMTFSTPINAADFDPAFVTVQTPIPDLRAEALHNTIALRGNAKGGTTHTVKVSTALTDSFGQALANETTAGWEVMPAQPRLLFDVDSMQVLDPAARQPTTSVHVMNMPEIHVLLHRVLPSDWPAWLAWQNTDREGAPPGVKVVDKRRNPLGRARFGRPFHTTRSRRFHVRRIKATMEHALLRRLYGARRSRTELQRAHRHCRKTPSWA